jgi:regulator of sigma E protease
MVSIVAVIFVFGVLIFIHEFGHFILAKKNGVLVERFSFGFGPKLWGKKFGETEYIISAVPLGGYIKMAGDEPDLERKGNAWEFLSKSCGQRAQIIVAGPILNYLLAFFLFSFIFIVGSPTLTTSVGQLIDDYPAKAAGIKRDDKILAVDGKKVEFWQDMAEIIHQKTEGQIVLTIRRDDRKFEVRVIPKVQEVTDIFGQKKKIGLIGIAPSEELTKIKYGWIRSFYEGGRKIVNLSALTLKALWHVLTRRLSFRESFAGPILIFRLTGDAAKMGLIYLLNLMGLLSMSLAIFNVLPLPVLDGGHLLFLLLERIRKRPISIRVQQVANQLGIIFLITLMIFVSYNDIVRSGWIEKIVEFWNRIHIQ